MTADYLANLRALGVTQIDHLPRATDNMDEIIKFITELIDRGYAYASDGDVFLRRCSRCRVWSVEQSNSRKPAR